MHNVSILGNLYFPFVPERIPESNQIQLQCYSINIIMLKAELVLLPKNIALQCHSNLGQVSKKIMELSSLSSGFCISENSNMPYDVLKVRDFDFYYFMK